MNRRIKKKIDNRLGCKSYKRVKPLKIKCMYFDENGTIQFKRVKVFAGFDISHWVNTHKTRRRDYNNWGIHDGQPVIIDQDEIEEMLNESTTEEETYHDDPTSM